MRLGRGERLGTVPFELGELAAFVLELLERELVVGLERARDEPILGLAGVELAASAASFELGALDREPLPDQPLVVLLLDLLDRLRRGADPGRCDRIEERVGDRAFQADAADGLAGVIGAVQVMRSHTRIPGNATVGP
jgi:hypothetical protein